MGSKHARCAIDFQPAFGPDRVGCSGAGAGNLEGAEALLSPAGLNVFPIPTCRRWECPRWALLTVRGDLRRCARAHGGEALTFIYYAARRPLQFLPGGALTTTSRAATTQNMVRWLTTTSAGPGRTINAGMPRKAKQRPANPDGQRLSVRCFLPRSGTTASEKNILGQSIPDQLCLG